MTTSKWQVVQILRKTCTERLTIETSKSTTVERKVKFTFADGTQITSEITSKTTFDRPKTGRNPYDADAITNLMEAVALVMAATAADEVERDL